VFGEKRLPGVRGSLLFFKDDRQSIPIIGDHHKLDRLKKTVEQKNVEYRTAEGSVSEML
jgi:hypothetical protein